MPLSSEKLDQVLNATGAIDWTKTNDPSHLALAREFLENFRDATAKYQSKVRVLWDMVKNPNVSVNWMMPQWESIIGALPPSAASEHPELYKKAGVKAAEDARGSADGISSLEPKTLFHIMRFARPDDAAQIARHMVDNLNNFRDLRQDLPRTKKEGYYPPPNLFHFPDEGMETSPEILNAFKTALQRETDPEAKSYLTHAMAQIATRVDPTPWRDAVMASDAPKGRFVLDTETRKQMSDEDIARSMEQVDKLPIHHYGDNDDGVHKVQSYLREQHPGAYKILTDKFLARPAYEDEKTFSKLKELGWYPEDKDKMRRAIHAMGGSAESFFKNVDASNLPQFRTMHHEVMLEDATPAAYKHAYASPKHPGAPDIVKLTPRERYETWRTLPETGAAFEMSKMGTEHWFPHMEHNHSVADVAKYVGDFTPSNYTGAQALLSMPGGPEFFRQKVLSNAKADKPWRKFVMALKPGDLHTIFRQEDIKQMIDAQLNTKQTGYKAILKAMQGGERSRLGGISKVKVNFTEKLRAARDYLEGRGGSAHYKELEKIGLNPKALGIEHLRDPKNQHISSHDVQHEIDKQPTIEYDVGHDRWTSSLQNHWTKTPNHVFQLNMTPEIKKKLKDALVWDDFQKLHEMSFRSGHPVTNKTLGWVRYSMDAGGNAHIDEIQSDLGQSTARQLERMEREGVTQGDIEEIRPHVGDTQAEQIQQGLQDAHQTGEMKRKARHLRYGVETASDIVWGGKHPSEVLHHAFLQAMRDSGLHGSDVQIWTAEPKSEISGQKKDSRGYAHDELQELAKKPVRPESEGANDFRPHAWSMLKGAGAIGSPEKVTDFFMKHREPETNLVKIERPLPVHMRQTYGDQPRQMGYKESEYGQVSVQGNKEHKGKTTWAQKLRKSEDSVRYLCDRVAYLSWYVGMREENDK